MEHIVFQKMINKMCICGCERVLTLTDCGCKVLQESVIKQLGKVLQDEGKAWFWVTLANHVVNLLRVGLTA